MNALPLAVLLPFLAVPAILALRNRPNVREGVSVATSVATFLLVAGLLPEALAGTPREAGIATFAPGLAVALRADALGSLFASVASFLWILTTVYSIGYMRGKGEHAQTRYFAFFAVVIGATIGVALSANLFSLLVFYEILTISTYPLVVHEDTPEAQRAGRKYLVYTLGGGGAILAGLALAYGLTGDVSFAAGGNGAFARLPQDAARAVAALLVAGFSVKAAVVPLHGWLPAAMVAPTPVSGLLHAVAVVKAGAFGILRTVFFFVGPDQTAALGLQPILITAAASTILIGSLLALIQDNLKLRLAYSTVGQLSYIVLGAALLTPDAATGAAFHIAGHGFAKLAMFFVAGAIAVTTGKTRVSELTGIGRTMPFASAAFALAAVAMAALPPMAPFVSKGFLSAAALEQAVPIVFVLVTSSLLNVAYFFPIVARAYLPAEGDARRGEAPALTVPLLASAIGALVLGTWLALPYGPFALASALPQAVFSAGPHAFEFWTGLHLAEIAPVVAAAAMTFLLVPRGHHLPGSGRFLRACEHLAGSFGRVYGSVVRGIAWIGRVARRSQTGDLNWNALGLVLGLLLVFTWLAWEVLRP